ncbi:hypothetical protein EVAR_30568_1 [Eumeta japonica]|uniref:Uncharacterized protein n=1 Tax=Eumeta variegata TaxID=151549 RepID=A0A4C1VQN4_EUMVA|nr:hypothetical protein EVAR_30568_1 [Eumeta japonica]
MDVGFETFTNIYPRPRVPNQWGAPPKGGVESRDVTASTVGLRLVSESSGGQLLTPHAPFIRYSIPTHEAGKAPVIFLGVQDHCCEYSRTAMTTYSLVAVTFWPLNIP